MRIRGVEIDNFLSFASFAWQDIDPHLNVIVGPNGAGKTNLFHALRAVVDVLREDRYAQRAILRQAAHRGRQDRPLRIALDLALDTPGEAALLRAFLAAALCSPQPSDTNRAANRLSTLLHDSRPDLDVTPFLAGRLVVDCDPHGAWAVRYEACSAAPWFLWHLERPSGGMFENVVDTTSTAAVQSAIREGYDEATRTTFDRYLEGAPERPPTPDLAALLVGHQAWFEVLGRHADRLPTHREFAAAAGLTLQHNRSYNAQTLFATLLQRSLIFTDNVRRGPQRTFSLPELQAPDTDFGSGERLALALFQLKNGVPGEQARYAAIQDMFRRLTRQRVDVGIAGASPAPQGPAAGDATGMSLALRVQTDWGALPLEYAGAGRGEALFLSAIVAGATGKILLLDEPAQNLHPTVQHTLLRELQSAAGNQFFVATHTPNLLPAEALHAVSRLTLREGQTHRTSLRLDGPARSRLGDIEQDLRQSADLRALFFCRAVALVEGETELGVLPLWFARVTGVDPETLDLVFIGVGGHSGFTRKIVLAQQFALPWAVVCDGPAVGAPGRNGGVCLIRRQLAAAGMTGLPPLDGDDFPTRRAALAQHGALTLAETADEEFEDVPGISEHLAEAKREVGSSKVQQGRYIAARYAPPLRVIALLEDLRERLLREEGEGHASPKG